MEEQQRPFDKKRRVVFVALPAHGNIHRETLKAALVYGATPRTDTVCQDRICSLLAYGFNSCWADFINRPDLYDYFCLLHADVQPWVEMCMLGDLSEIPHEVRHLGGPGPWLDVMIEELESDSYDVMHAVTAIKDERGVTSTGVGDINEPHQWIRKITTTELNRMPETFGLDAVLEVFGNTGFKPDAKLCLMPNTGCLLIKQAPKWRKFPGFCMRDRLAVRMKDGFLVMPTFDQAQQTDDELLDVPGDIVAVNIPEDWNFGLWCARHRFKVGATRRVKTNHWGQSCYPSSYGWGQEHDSAFFHMMTKSN